MANLTPEARERWASGEATTADFAAAGLPFEAFLRYSQAAPALRQAAGLTLLVRVGPGEA